MTLTVPETVHLLVAELEQLKEVWLVLWMVRLMEVESVPEMAPKKVPKMEHQSVRRTERERVPTMEQGMAPTMVPRLELYWANTMVPVLVPKKALKREQEWERKLER